MAKKGARFYWMTPRAHIDTMPTSLAIDMLRYDGARVETNAPGGYYLFSSDGEGKGPNVERLRSYHCAPVWQSGTAVSHDFATGEAWNWFHRQPKVTTTTS